MIQRERIVVTAGAIGLLAALIVAACSQQSAKSPEEMKKEQIARGEYLVNLGGCNDCHSPKTFTATDAYPNPSILLSGHPASEPLAAIPEGLPNPQTWVGLCNAHMTAWVGPWGVTFAANLTPDKATGMGEWTEAQFMASMRNGKHMGEGRMILPPMPWQSIGKLTDDDLKAMFAYLQSIPAVPNLVPGPVPPPQASAPTQQ